MEIRSEATIRYPLERVWRTWRDRLPEIAKYNPDIREIVTVSRAERDGRVELHNEWASAAEVPPIAAKLLKPDQLRWDDHAVWDDATHTATWRIVTRAFTEAVKCTGTTRFFPLPSGDTRVLLEGALEIDLREIPGVPKFLAGTIGPQVERFVVGMIAPNLEKMNTAGERLLDDEPTAGRGA